MDIDTPYYIAPSKRLSTLFHDMRTYENLPLAFVHQQFSSLSSEVIAQIACLNPVHVSLITSYVAVIDNVQFTEEKDMLMNYSAALVNHSYTLSPSKRKKILANFTTEMADIFNSSSNARIENTCFTILSKIDEACEEMDSHKISMAGNKILSIMEAHENATEPSAEADEIPPFQPWTYLPKPKPKVN